MSGIDDELERAQIALGDRQEYGTSIVYDQGDVLAHCHEHPAYEDLQTRALSGERSTTVRNALELIWNWAAAVVACHALGINPDETRLVTKALERIEAEIALGGFTIDLKEAA